MIVSIVDPEKQELVFFDDYDDISLYGNFTSEKQSEQETKMKEFLKLEVLNETIYQNKNFKSAFDTLLDQANGPFDYPASDYFQDPNGGINNG